MGCLSPALTRKEFRANRNPCPVTPRREKGFLDGARSATGGRGRCNCVEGWTWQVVTVNGLSRVKEYRGETFK